MILLEFDIFPISVNKLYSTRFGQHRRFLTTEGRKFKDTINKEVTDKLADSHLYELVSSFIGKPLEVTVDVYSSSWLLKDEKTMRVKDIDNLSKALLDSIFTAVKECSIQIDDNQIWTLHLNKHFTKDPDKTTVRIKLFAEEV
ncbi:MAG: RusA family crossover junction endodeoxyribonuclease [Ignisphaera sp.]|nr:RusA family crossover junction endodeoxyribonuclease [Ignisphaera sp.]